MIDETAIRNRYEAMLSRLDERGRRLFAAAEAYAAGYGGVSAVARATGIARGAIDRGLKELDALGAARKIRRAGGGRLSLTRKDPTLLEDLRKLLELSDARRSHAAAPMGVQEPRQTRARVARHGASRF